MNQTWQEQIEEYGDLHNADCDINDEGGSFDGCHCENMKQIKAFVQKTLDDRDKFWVECLEAHRKHCTAEGNKKLTLVKKAFLASLKR
jgi:hypothetical protein